MLFKHSGIYILAKFIPGLMAFVGLSIYTHLLEPEQYGIFTLITSGTILLHNVIYNWLPAGTLRFWANDTYSRTTFTSTLATSYIRISLFLLFLVIIGIIYFHSKQVTSIVLTSYFFLLSLTIFTITQNLFTAKIEPLQYAYITISYSVISLGLGALFASLGYGASGVVIGIGLGALIPALFVFKQTWLPLKKGTYSKELHKKLLTYGLPFASAALLEEFTKVSDRFMLAWLQDKSTAGLYAVGYDLSGNSILLIMAAINLAAYPTIIKLLETKGKEASMKYFKHYVVLLLGVSIPAVVGLNLVGPSLVHLLIDEQYQESVIFLLPWITSAVFVMGLQAFYFDLAFQLDHYVITVVKIGILIAVLNFCLNYWLIPIMGLKGAAIATLSSFTLGSFLSAILGRRRFTLPFPLKDFAKILVASFIMGLSLWLLKDYRGWGWLILQLLTGLGSYLLLMIAFNILEIRTHIKNYLNPNQ